VEIQTNIFEDVGLVEEEREKMWNVGYMNIVILFSYVHLYNQRCDQHLCTYVLGDFCLLECDAMYVVFQMHTHILEKPTTTSEQLKSLLHICWVPSITSKKTAIFTVSAISK